MSQKKFEEANVRDPHVVDESGMNPDLHSLYFPPAYSPNDRDPSALHEPLKQRPLHYLSSVHEASMSLRSVHPELLSQY